MSQRALARIDLAAVKRNCAELGRLLGKGRLCAVVKADGYGHGAAHCARAALAGGADWLAVATAGEAAELRDAGIGERILVMGALSKEELAVALDADADVVAWREPFVMLAASRAAQAARPARLHVKLDTGMGRLGTADTDEALGLVQIAARDPGLELAGFMTHFATADEPDSGFFDEQLARFAPVAGQVKSAHPNCIVHAANSAAVFRDPEAHFDMARCGIAVYGLDPFTKIRRIAAWCRRLHSSHTSPTSSRSPPARASATAGAGTPNATHSWACCRSDTGTDTAAASPTART